MLVFYVLSEHVIFLSTRRWTAISYKHKGSLWPWLGEFPLEWMLYTSAASHDLAISFPRCMLTYKVRIWQYLVSKSSKHPVARCCNVLHLDTSFSRMKKVEFSWWHHYDHTGDIQPQLHVYPNDAFFALFLFDYTYSRLSQSSPDSMHWKNCGQQTLAVLQNSLVIPVVRDVSSEGDTLVMNRLRDLIALLRMINVVASSWECLRSASAASQTLFLHRVVENLPRAVDASSI